MKQKEINIENYQAWLIDYAEGTLTPDEINQLKTFIHQNPHLKEDFDFAHEEINTTTIHQPNKQKLSVDFKQHLKITPTQNIDAENYQDYLIANLEGLLSRDEQAELEYFLLHNPIARKEAKIFNQTILQPDQKLIFENKAQLKKQTPVFYLSLKKAIRYSAAASILLFIALYILNNPEPKQNKITLAKGNSELTEENLPKKDEDQGQIKKLLPEHETVNNVSTKKIKPPSEVETLKTNLPNTTNVKKINTLPVRSMAKLDTPKNLALPIGLQFENFEMFAEIAPQKINNINSNQETKNNPKNDFQTLDSYLVRQLDEKVLSNHPENNIDRVVGITNKVLNRLFNSKVVIEQNQSPQKPDLFAFYSPVFEIERKK